MTNLPTNSGDLTHVVFFSHEVGCVSYSLTGHWSVRDIAATLASGIVWKDEGIIETMPGEMVDIFQDTLLKTGREKGVVNSVKLSPDALGNIIMKTKAPNKNEVWVMIEMPWATIHVDGKLKGRFTTKQWMKEVKDERRTKQ